MLGYQTSEWLAEVMPAWRDTSSSALASRNIAAGNAAAEVRVAETGAMTKLELRADDRSL